MKKLMPVLLLLNLTAHAQIVFENTYSNSLPGFGQLGVVNLSASGYKYMISDTAQITLYNLNHSVFRTIQIPAQNDMYYPTFRVLYVSEELFNLNPGDIEFMITYQSNSTNEYRIRVYNEAGNLEFGRDSFLVQTMLGYGLQQTGIMYTSSGVKMIITHQVTYAAEVYSLPGSLPCNECSGGVISGIQGQTFSETQKIGDPYPNPTNGTTTIPYELPEGVNTGTLIIYDLLGREVKRYTVTGAFSTLEIQSGELAPGTYQYNLVTSQRIIPGKRIVVTQ